MSLAGKISTRQSTATAALMPAELIGLQSASVLLSSSSSPSDSPVLDRGGGAIGGPVSKTTTPLIMISAHEPIVATHLPSPPYIVGYLPNAIKDAAENIANTSAYNYAHHPDGGLRSSASSYEEASFEANIDTVVISWDEIALRFQRAYDIVFCLTASIGKKAHFDCVEKDDKIIDGAKAQWWPLLCIDAVMYLVFYKQHATTATRRAFDQHSTLRAVVLSVFREVVISNDNIASRKNIPSASFRAIRLDVSNYWRSFDSLRQTLLERANSNKSLSRFTRICYTLCGQNPLLGKFELADILQQVLSGIIFSNNPVAIVMNVPYVYMPSAMYSDKGGQAKASASTAASEKGAMTTDDPTSSSSTEQGGGGGVVLTHSSQRMLAVETATADLQALNNDKNAFTHASGSPTLYAAAPEDNPAYDSALHTGVKSSIKFFWNFSSHSGPDALPQVVPSIFANNEQSGGTKVPRSAFVINEHEMRMNGQRGLIRGGEGEISALLRTNPVSTVEAEMDMDEDNDSASGGSKSGFGDEDVDELDQGDEDEIEDAFDEDDG